MSASSLPLVQRLRLREDQIFLALTSALEFLPASRLYSLRFPFKQ